jgi:glycosyltransferase involved in cell wall biosynthesis
MNKRLSIAQFNDGYPPVTDGVVTCVRNYAYWLNKKYGECTLVVPDRRGVVYHEPYRVVSYASFPLVKRAPYRVGLPELDYKYRQALKQLDFDVVHTHSPFSAGLEALRLKRERGTPVIGTFHSKYYDDLYDYTGSKLLSKTGVSILMYRFSQMNSVWTVSEGAAQTLRAYGFKGPITVVQNGTDLIMPEDPAAMREDARQIVPEIGDVPVFLYVGQLVWQKNLRLIVDACERLANSGERFLMVMVGDGPVRRDLAALIGGAGISDFFRFTGVVSDRRLLSALYLSARAFVFPSLYDTSALVVKEAAAVACPAIAVSGSHAAQGMVHNMNSLLCENNVESLTEAMRFALHSPDEMERIGSGARATLQRSWESVVDEVYLLYKDIILENRRRTKDKGAD